MKHMLLLLLAAGLLLPGCAIYLLMQCAAPQINDQKQVELTGSTYLNGRVEVAAAYSPLRHLLVRAARSSRADDSRDSSYYRGRQTELALGTYWSLGQRQQWLLGALGGYGWARSNARYLNDGASFIVFGTPTRRDLAARYTRPFGEVYVSLQAAERVALGAAYRVTAVRFQTLTDQGIPVPLRAMTRGEPMLFARVGLGPRQAARLRLALGSSNTFGYNERLGRADESAEAQVLKGRGYYTLSVSLLPHLLAGKANNK